MLAKQAARLSALTPATGLTKVKGDNPMAKAKRTTTTAKRAPKAKLTIWDAVRENRNAITALETALTEQGKIEQLNPTIPREKAERTKALLACEQAVKLAHKKDSVATFAVIHTPPTTILGAIHVLEHVIDEREHGNDLFALADDEHAATIFLRGISGFLRNTTIGLSIPGSVKLR
jgi:hypothetical protein